MISTYNTLFLSLLILITLSQEEPLPPEEDSVKLNDQARLNKEAEVRQN